MACHLLKAVEGWSDLGYGDFSIHYLRDKAKREVDFVVTRDNAPWFLVEVKKSKENLSGSLAYFQQKTHAKHAFQAIVEAEYVDGDCFAYYDPISVPAKTFFESIAVMEPTQRKKVFRIAIECAGRIRRGARAVSHRGRREIPAGFYRSRAGYFKARPKKLKKLCDSIQPAQKRFVLLCVKKFRTPRRATALPPLRTRNSHAWGARSAMFDCRHSRLAPGYHYPCALRTRALPASCRQRNGRSFKRYRHFIRRLVTGKAEIDCFIQSAPATWRSPRIRLANVYCRSDLQLEYSIYMIRLVRRFWYAACFKLGGGIVYLNISTVAKSPSHSFRHQVCKKQHHTGHSVSNLE